jgi:hypothetical protein
VTSFTDPDLRARHRRGARALAAVVATRTLALALAACGSSNSNSSSNSGGSSSSNSSSASSSSSSGVRQAQAQLKQYEATSTKITISESLKSAPPKGKTLVMLGTSDPNNVKIQKAYKQLCQLAGWNYQQVIYSQGDTGSFNAALDAAITKKADYISEAGVPLTPSLINKVKAAGAKWALISVNPVDVQDPEGGCVLAGREVLLVGADVEKVNVNGGVIATSLERV